MRKVAIKKYGRWVKRTPGREINDLTDNLEEAHFIDTREDAEAHVIKANASKGEDGRWISNGWPEGVQLVDVEIIFCELLED